MKKSATLIICAFFALVSCSDDSVQGPPGPPGPSGENGFIGTAIDLTGDFTAANSYTLELFFNDPEINLEVLESDAVLVYVKASDGEDSNGNPVEIYNPLPQTYFLSNKTVQYNFDFTYEDVYIFIDGINTDGTPLDFAALAPAFRLNQKFRIIVLPANFAQTRQQLDLNNMNAVMKALNIREADVIKAN
ncbi:hypothetical protein JM83_3058 [Gillisia sp. Hel_I_86]|uniref:collagen-like protein n=1 Tax=Gillisia sp. Hel_I_86 TaxID=1249981 RepID=UPI001198F9E2|nr:collagen-like protein [Gillisia sp. Hel_I_86]TVZ27976.1 hypothetical protein JM83_3058 [Gillisia sp. Hel_I_86]